MNETVDGKRDGRELSEEASEPELQERRRKGDEAALRGDRENEEREGR